MTYEEALARFKTFENFCDDNDCDCDCKKCDDMNRIIIEALEKQIPKKPKEIEAIDSNDNAVVECVCGATQEVAVKSIKSVYCWRCGQRLDWSDIPDWEEIDWSFIGVEAE